MLGLKQQPSEKHLPFLYQKIYEPVYPGKIKQALICGFQNYDKYFKHED